MSDPKYGHGEGAEIRAEIDRRAHQALLWLTAGLLVFVAQGAIQYDLNGEQVPLLHCISAIISIVGIFLLNLLFRVSRRVSELYAEGRYKPKGRFKNGEKVGSIKPIEFISKAIYWGALVLLMAALSLMIFGFE